MFGPVLLEPIRSCFKKSSPSSPRTGHGQEQMVKTKAAHGTATRHCTLSWTHCHKADRAAYGKPVNGTKSHNCKIVRHWTFAGLVKLLSAKLRPGPRRSVFRRWRRFGRTGGNGSRALPKKKEGGEGVGYTVEACTTKV